jgi:hypothetical protein
MKTIEEIHDFIDLVERKERGSYHTPAQKDAALDIAQRELFKQYVDDYLNSKTKTLPTALYPFRIKDTFTTDVDGVIDTPSNWNTLISIYLTSGTNIYPVRMVEDVELPDALNSQLRKVVTEKPIAFEENRTIQIYPAAVRNGVYIYLREPKSPVFAYTQVGRVITYDDGNSQQIEFDGVYHPKLIAKTLQYLGVNMSEAEIANFGSIKDAQITT